MESNLPSESNSSSLQTVIIIILIIIGIILFIYLLIESVFIPPIQITPFTDGSIIRIKALSNNKYLRPFTCADLSCTIPYVCSSTGPSPYNIVVADGVLGDGESIEWVLCQRKSKPSSTSKEIEAAYLISSRTNQSGYYMFSQIGGEVLIADPQGSVCVSESSSSIDCASVQLYFNFILQEKEFTAGNTINSNQNGTYLIHSIDPCDWIDRPCSSFTACPAGQFYYLYCNGGEPFFQTCPNPVVQVYSNFNTSAPDKNSIEEVLNYSFLIEVVGRVS